MPTQFGLRGSPLSHAYPVWSTSVSAFVSYSVYRKTTNNGLTVRTVTVTSCWRSLGGNKCKLSSLISVFLFFFLCHCHILLHILVKLSFRCLMDIYLFVCLSVCLHVFLAFLFSATIRDE